MPSTSSFASGVLAPNRSAAVSAGAADRSDMDEVEHKRNLDKFYVTCPCRSPDI